MADIVKMRPMTYYCRLDKTEIITTQGGQHLQVFSQKPDAAKLNGNYDKEFIQKIMEIQGIKVRVGPVLPYGSKATGYPVGTYGFTIDAFKNATFQLKINDTPVFTWKGSTLLGGIECKTVSDGAATPAVKVYHTQKDNTYKIFKDMGKLYPLKTKRSDLVKVTIDLPTALVTADVPSDFTLTVYLLTNSEYTVYTK